MYNHYSPANDNVAANADYQGIDFSLSREKQEATDYSGVDQLRNATIHDDRFFISTTDCQHAALSSGQPISSDDHTSLSGYFTNRATAERHLNGDGTFDSYGYHRDLCVKPTIYATDPQSDIPTDKRHLDEFVLDRDRLEQIYGTRDFNAAIGKCNANNQFGSDGGDQGFNANLSELYNNGCFKYAGTRDADPASTVKCQSELTDMTKDAQGKCKATLAGKSPEEIQKIGYPLDSRCHEQTSFNATPRTDLANDYKDFKPSYNEELAKSTTNQDRLHQPTLNQNDGAQTRQEGQPAGPTIDQIDSGRNPQSNENNVPAGPTNIDPQRNASAENNVQGNPVPAGPEKGTDFADKGNSNAVKNVAENVENLAAQNGAEGAKKVSNAVTGGIT